MRLAGPRFRERRFPAVQRSPLDYQRKFGLPRRDNFYLSDDQWAAIAPLLPSNQPGARRVDDRRVLSGIVHVLRTGCRW
ncbi:MAG: transposase, partial [Acetobacteraceae bacterium]|nr:transposase [Acetobacteraceae bacterium]